MSSTTQTPADASNARDLVPPTLSADLTMTTIALDILIEAHRNVKPSRERALLITKLQEARMWCREAFALDDGAI